MIILVSDVFRCITLLYAISVAFSLGDVSDVFFKYLFCGNPKRQRLCMF